MDSSKVHGKKRDKVTRDQKGELRFERGLKEDLFNDYYCHRGKIYRTNFVRGIFFGLGTVIGGTILIAIIVGILSSIVSFSPDFISDPLNQIVELLQKRL